MKTPVLKSLFNKLYQKETPAQVFSCEYCEILRKAFFIKHRGDCFWPLPLPFEIIIETNFQLFSLL